MNPGYGNLSVIDLGGWLETVAVDHGSDVLICRQRFDLELEQNWSDELVRPDIN